MDYKQAGVDIEEGYKAVGKYREFSAKTVDGKAAGAVLNGIGSFAGMYSLKEFFAGMEEPVLVSGTDGVGTKLDIAFKMKKYDTVGIDCVAMCVNDILCHGARPLFFLDYLACGKLDADVAAEIVKGVAIGCRETGSVLLGGETAEMPGFYDAGKYDIAGFSVGIVDRAKIVDGAKIREGDTLVGIASSGPHSNGFSLIRKTLPDINEDFGGMPLGMALLEPTRLYVKPVLSLMEKIEIHGMANITGGGFYENIPRMFKDGSPVLDAVITEGSWTIPPIFARIAAAINSADSSGPAAQKRGAELLKTDEVLRKQMFNTFNMGIGFVLALAPADARQAIEHLDTMNFPAYTIGKVEKAADVNAAQGVLRFAGN
ncbi:MAG: phosphoribosylformylglycinamidine cyclo-ligase [Treponema sp.]|jgi:phosphoribosylformylglycinamidine cyclo-ligase|nr:phosphoribosylformylglycinamidine cyclo-ligase [Treponema sp.]